MIHDKSRKEWGELITNNKNVDINSFSLKMLVNNLKRSYEHNMISLSEAVDELHKTCTKYEKLYSKDLEKIFK